MCRVWNDGNKKSGSPILTPSCASVNGEGDKVAGWTLGGALKCGMKLLTRRRHTPPITTTRSSCSTACHYHENCLQTEVRPKF